MQDAIVVQELSKKFYRYHVDKPTTLVETFVRGLRHIRPKEVFWGLRDVSFNVAPGQIVGVIGRNGAGKSTLLRLIGGVARPDKGRVKTLGRIGGFLDLTAGLRPDLTGRENVFVSGVIAGLTRREVKQRFDSIVAFAEVEEFIDSPLRTYSTGMQMRLAFAVVAHTNPDILLIDEVLAVGDMAFQRKCLERIARFKAEGCAILLVSHDTNQIRQLCDKALWLRTGLLVAQGPTEVVADQYVAEMTTETKRRTPAAQPVLHTSTGTDLRVNENRFGSLELEIVAVHLLDSAGLPVTEFEGGYPLHIKIEFLAPQPIESPIFGATISREDGFVCYDTSTEAAGLSMPAVHGQGRVILQLERLDLNGGSYYVDVGAYERDWAYAYDYHWHVYPLHVCSTGGEKGVLRPPHRWELDCTSESQKEREMI